MANEEELRQIFDEMDANADGTITIEEATAYLVDKRGFSQEFLKDFFLNFDRNSDGSITVQECREQLGLAPKQELECSAWYRVFRSFDKDGSGFIEADELPKVMEEIGSVTRYDRSHFERWIAKRDTNADGKVSYDEFLAWIRGGAQQ